MEKGDFCLFGSLQHEFGLFRIHVGRGITTIIHTTHVDHLPDALARKFFGYPHRSTLQFLTEITAQCRPIVTVG